MRASCVLSVLLAAVATASPQCSGDDVAVLNGLGSAFPQKFFACYSASSASQTGSCLATDLPLVDGTCAACLVSVSQCVQDSCASKCVASPFPPACVSCASQSCQATLSACSKSSAAFESCSAVLCNQPAWALPVIIACSIVGFGLLLVLACACYRRSRADDYHEQRWRVCCCCDGGGGGGNGNGDVESGFCPALCGEDSCCESLYHCVTLKDPDTVRFDREQSAREQRLALFKEKAASDRNAPGFKVRAGSPRSNDFPPDDEDNFSFTSPIGIKVRDEVKSARVDDDADEADDDIGTPRSQTVAEHNIRVSRLPKDFRASFSPGLTPEQLFGTETLRMMNEANEQATAVPKAVIASHKALKMMGVQEADVQKPYSETVQERVQRMARAAAVSSGAAVGGSLTGVGQQVAEASVLKQREAEKRAMERRRREELRKEEARIRAEIELQNKAEKQETEVRKSQKLSANEAARLSGALQDRKSRGKPGTQGGSKLKEFITNAEGSQPPL